ncbi:hypothetical protein Pst134EA_032735 [Puccinia striiformis f. sp. tritici]|uniref:uncharacterized protein n=1 Tax=Puccinia striiformis f. sp. tritici TaxID=168172 RepID=UPI0020071F2D|nr:uncharacterized protein Pst134EA_032735 [Puccinia striiformis f. sp. tritici]KAH9441633.1 hypothetical protein Pst134EA_032735 [Puccinia striiformis f. sp. tritici]
MTTTPVEPENHVDLTSTINPSSSQQQNPSVGNPSRNEGPPEIKTALKSSALKSRASTAMNPSPDASGSSISNGPLQSSHTVPKTTSQQQSNKIDQQTSMENNDQLIPETSSSSISLLKKYQDLKPLSKIFETLHSSGLSLLIRAFATLFVVVHYFWHL